MDEIKAKQQVVEKIKESSKILVTVSDSPSVDALSAALALTLVLDKQEKYATAIFSGETPPAIAFLEPEKTFDDTTDSLRDFIIALNKEKADHLRYKVEGDSVKIFITPYKTTIDQSDLEFSQGDYNVELVIALGVDNQDHLDKALEDHGQILHDATIITMTAGDLSSSLGGIDWHDAGSSSLSEMVAGLAEALKEDKKKPLIDATIATALLTGIVAETDRFSNEHTTSKAMTVSATLMAAGADQQLIANELQASQAIPEPEAPAEAPAPEESDAEVDTTSPDGTLTIKTHEEHDPSSLAISHEGETLADLDRRVLGDDKAKEKVTEEVEALQEAAAEEEAHEEVQEAHSSYAPEEEVSPVAEPAVEAAPVPAPETIPAPSPEPEIPAAPVVEAPVVNSYVASDEVAEPTLGGTLNASTEQAAEDARREAESDQNRTILSHSYLGTSETTPGSEGVSTFPGTPSEAPGSSTVGDFAPSEEVHSAYAPEQEHVIQPLNPSPADLGLPLPPPIPDFSQVNGAAPALPVTPTAQPAILGDILAPEPPAFDATANAIADPSTAYAPDFGTTLQPPAAPFTPEPTPQQPPASNDPGQFQIPPQP